MPHDHTVRVTGVLLHEGRLLIVRQRVNRKRDCSLPGGKLEPGETMTDGLIREMREETGLDVRVVRLLYVCERPEDRLVHVTFLLEADSLDALRLPTNALEATPIHAIEMVAPEDLPAYGFSGAWAERVAGDFPDAPRYAGRKEQIGLG